jgi:endonuclease/exonuclease/phosphatase family metal-dependent hydrolase
VATFNASLFRESAGALADELQGESEHASAIASILAEVRPDIVLINEFDVDSDAAEAFHERFLEPAGSELSEYRVFASNTGVHSGLDLDQNGSVDDEPGSRNYGGDAWGFGEFEGQYGFVVFSRYPIGEVRTFQELKWSSMPEHVIPTDFYPPELVSALRLSSKNHVDVEVLTPDGAIHLLASHPTPPVFDGPEDRNGRRNHDEVRFWVDYVDPGLNWMADDAEVEGGMPDGAHFVIVGDLNVDPMDGDRREAIRALLTSEYTRDSSPQSAGAAEAAELQGGANANHTGPSDQDTADFNDNGVGNLRVDYATPSRTLLMGERGVYWPTTDDASENHLYSDHRLVWVDVQIPASD